MNSQRTLPIRAAWTVFALIAAAHLVARLVDAETVANVSQWFLMPALAGTVWLATSAPRGRLVVLVLIALGFSWLGDTAPDLSDGDTSFLLMVGFFLLAQITYIVAFVPYNRDGVMRRHRALVAGYAVVVVLLVAACAPGAGALLVPALVYGTALGVMAVLSAGLGRTAAIGGGLFLVSDGMIALGAFADWFGPPVEGFWIMATYIAAQVLIVVGVLAKTRDHHDGASVPHVLAGNG
ncbi:lysoplasmalogenase [Rhodococcus sp. OK519]|uniref:lysoplasmalogenase n=1 Tax=Rhodococcus sp. OK519 TaxID=2135729 RepID=UPI000D3975A9